MKPLSRAEKIEVVKGLMYWVGIIIIVMCTVMLWKVRAEAHHCGFISYTGKVEDTGLYGNCSWIDSKLYAGKEVTWTPRNDGLEIPTIKNYTLNDI